MTEVEIKDLITRAKAGDTDAFGCLYTEYLTPVYRYVYFRIGDKTLADDLTHDIFIKVFSSIQRFSIGEKSPLAYFFTVARNTLIDTYRKRHFPTVTVDDAENELVGVDNPEKNFIAQEGAEGLSQALRKISPMEAEAITLKFIHNYSNEEIAQIMEKSESAIRQLQSRGIRALRSIIKKEDFS